MLPFTPLLGLLGLPSEAILSPSEISLSGASVTTPEFLSVLILKQNSLFNYLERERDLPATGSLPKWPQQPDLNQAKSQELESVSHADVAAPARASFSEGFQGT